jgi:hypothetical protein
MRRPAKGGTTHPTQQRPGMGYGRPLRPRPAPVATTDLVAELHAFLRGDSTVVVEDAVLPAETGRTPVGELDVRS